MVVVDMRDIPGGVTSAREARSIVVVHMRIHRLSTCDPAVSR